MTSPNDPPRAYPWEGHFDAAQAADAADRPNTPNSQAPWSVPKQTPNSWPPPEAPGPVQSSQPYPPTPYGQPAWNSQPYPSGPYGQPAWSPQPYSSSPYGQPAWQPAPLKVDGYAITSLIFGLIGGVVFSLGFGIRALRRIGRGERRGKGLAVTGLVLSGVWVLVAASLIAYFAGRAPTRSSNGTVIRAGQISPAQLHIGDCVKIPLSLQSGIRSLPVVPCSTPHNGQVFAAFQALNSDYPGREALTQQGLTDCQSQMAGFLGTSMTLLDVGAFVPDSTGWSLGDRTEHCLLIDRRHDITGDIRNDP